MAALASLIFCPAAGRSAAGQLAQALQLLGEQPLLAQEPHPHLVQSAARSRDALHVREGLLDERRENVCSGH